MDDERDVKVLTIALLDMTIRDEYDQEWYAHDNTDTGNNHRCENCGQHTQHIYLRKGGTYFGRCPECVSLEHRWGRFV